MICNILEIEKKNRKFDDISLKQVKVKGRVMEQRHFKILQFSRFNIYLCKKKINTSYIIIIFIFLFNFRLKLNTLKNAKLKRKWKS